MTPFYECKDAVLYFGDCRVVLSQVSESSADAVVTDPPYELGFMGKSWDGSGVSFRPETWAAALRVLKPGGHLLAFGGSRTFHRIACAIEGAGFEIRDTLSWLYGTGFPKSLNLGDGRGTALKPAWEPVILARKPLAGTVAANVQAWGTGALNVDGCRINPGEIVRGGGNGKAHNGGRYGAQETSGTRPVVQPHALGRWPANVVLDEEAAATLDAQTEALQATARQGKVKAGSAPRSKSLGDIDRPETKPGGYADSGGASRFFYVAKASRVERGAGNTHPTVKPLALMRWLVRLVTPPGGLVLDPFAGSGTTLLAARAEGFRTVGVEMDPTHCDIIVSRLESPQKPGQEGQHLLFGDAS